MLNSLFSRFDNVIIIDTETTGINPKTEEIIEFGATKIMKSQDKQQNETELDMLVRLSPDRRLSPVITKITGISQDMLMQNGVTKSEACKRLIKILDCSKPLVVAYNAQFDLCFLYYFLQRFGQANLLKKVNMLDALTIYKDRRDYPHKLENAVEAYHLSLSNTHRALDDARATLALLCAMEAELDDLEKYINLFGYNPKYGISGQKISSVKYIPQPYFSGKKIYE